jgi:hypothetical protein
MQIYELTNGTKKTQLVEGIWDSVRQAFTADPKLSGLNAAQRASMFSQNRKMMEIGKKARDSWQVYAKQLENTIQNPVAKTAFQQRTDGKYENALRAFVQKNLLPKYIRYNNLINAQDIDTLIKEISDTANANPAKQTQLWNELIQQSAVAQTAPEALAASPTGTATPASATPTTPTTPTGTATPAAAPTPTGTATPAAAPTPTSAPVTVNAADILDLAQNLGMNNQLIKNLGLALRQLDPASVGSTGNAAVDEFLKLLGL